MEALTDRILRDNAEDFDAMVNHRFVEDIKADRLPKQVFDRYLVFEGAFVDTAVSIFAYATAKSETIRQRRRLVGVLDALVNEQMAYFEHTFATRGIDPAKFDTSIEDVSAFREGMLSIARDGSYLDIVAAMFGAEWMYWTWSKKAAGISISDLQLREWVDLHANDEFAAQAHWLKSELDEAGPALCEAQKSRMSSIFGHVQRLEIAFHHAPYR